MPDAAVLPTRQKLSLPKKPFEPRKGYDPDFIRDWPITSEDGLIRTLSIRRDAVGWCIEARDDPAGKTIVGIRGQGAKPIPISVSKAEFEAWWRPELSQKESKR